MMHAQGAAGESSPPLSILQLDMSVNATDRQLRDNLESAKARGLPTLELQPAHERVLAIVGSGPSLRDHWALIPRDCDVMALNGAYRLLRARGRESQYFAMLDARECNTVFIENGISQATEMLLASQCHSKVFELADQARRVWDKGPRGRTTVFHLNTPTTHAIFPDETLYVGGGGTIGLTALALAYALGYRKVMLYGFDSSFEGDATHALPQLQNAGENTLDVWVKDRKYRTTHAMAQQVMDFFPFYEALKKVAPEFEIHVIGRGLFYDFIATNNQPSTREKELAKYVTAYEHDDYGMTQERRDGLDGLIGELSGESYLDVSTGRGEVLELADKHGFKTVQGTETVPALLTERVTRAILPHLPFEDRAFDVVSLIEVIEHLLPEDVRPALLELNRVARRHILLSAATMPHWLGGVNLHPSARPEEDWEALFREVWGGRVRRVRNLGLSPCWRVDL